MAYIYEDNSKQDLIEYSNWSLVRDIGKFIKPYKFRFIFSSLSRFFSDIAGLYPSFGFALIVTFFSKYRAGDSLGYFWLIMSLIAAAYFFKYFGRYLAKLVGYQVSEKIAIDSQLLMIRHLSLLDIAWHERENAGNKLKRIQKGADGLNHIVRMWINNFIEIGINFVGMIYVLGRFDGTVGLIMIVFLLSYFSVSFFMLRRASSVSQEVDIMEEGISGLMFQAINNIRSVKVLAMAEKIIKIVKEQAGKLFDRIRLRVFRFQTRSVVLNFLSAFFRVGTIVFIAYGIAYRHYEVGLLVLFNGYFNSLVESVDELSEATQDLVVYKYGIARMMRTLKEPVVIDRDKDKVEFPKHWKKISVKNLSFSYGKNKVLKDVSFEILRGQRIGIVGLSGAGKSTLFKLLLKENENYDGEILIDGISIRKIKKKSYISRMGVVLQDTEVFNFTLRDNIRIASAFEHGEKRLGAAIDIAHVSDFIDKLPQGLDTFIGEKGIKLSGGERQRLGIARAVYKKPEILFLDEATSHLDLESEEKIRDSLQKFFQEVTAIVIAHRLSTISQMDKILVIEKGRVAESGSFGELYKSKGRLFELWEKQKL